MPACLGGGQTKRDDKNADPHEYRHGRNGQAHPIDSSLARGDAQFSPNNRKEHHLGAAILESCSGLVKRVGPNESRSGQSQALSQAGSEQPFSTTELTRHGPESPWQAVRG